MEANVVVVARSNHYICLSPPPRILMPCITLLSDFGLEDAHAACTRGILMQYVDTMPVIDISHQITPYYLHQASYMVAGAYKHFPKNSFHLLLFNIFGSVSGHRIVLCRHDDHYFLAPDNGILPMSFPQIDTVWSCYEETGTPSLYSWIHKSGEIIRSVSQNPEKTAEYRICSLYASPKAIAPILESNLIEGHVIHIDRFENVIVNITRAHFESVGQGRPFHIRFMRNEEIRDLRKHYTEVAQGEKLVRFNSAGFLEIAINHGAAASLFGLKIRKDSQLLYNTITIFFDDHPNR